MAGAALRRAAGAGVPYRQAVMEQRCGRDAEPLSQDALTELQAQILGPRAIRYGVRRSPVFVGEVDGFTEVVHYIAPHWDDAPALLTGLRAFAARTVGGSPLVRAAVLSFGFVYIHPMSDGNGRISRFLINDVLRRDQAVPDPFVLPVSATITGSVVNRRGYDQVLELFSKPLMRQYHHAWRFGTEQVAVDGVHYNLQFDAYRDALPAWRYLNLTEHVEYLAQVVQATIEHEMRKEAGTLRSLRVARERVKQESCPTRCEPGAGRVIPRRNEPGRGLGAAVGRLMGSSPVRRVDHPTDGDRHERSPGVQLGAGAPGAGGNTVAGVPARAG